MDAVNPRTPPARVVAVRLNQQQRELVDNSVRAGEAASPEALLKRALREFAAARLPTKTSR